MAAPSTGFEVTNNLAGATPPFFLGQQTIADGAELSVELLNVTELVCLTNTGEADLKVTVYSGSSACFYLLKSGASVTLKMSTTKFQVRNDSGDGTAGAVTGYASLTSRAAAYFPDLTDANGFDGVQSHDGTRVAVA
ncbi:MAG: hypothetical protein H6698_09670 [Myxococcales bacterium]|nr:hypothetical protein [Myxococcales bacterium]MCB9532648.1 hypothetical protein [Myxococcales bacterium]MCB9534550.1 hypothetical protein [Myxococcales bacterium]